MPFKGGIKAAAEMLSGMDREGQERILADIAQKDPQMAEALRKTMVTFEDLQYLTVKMLVELLREIEIEDLARGLRISSDTLKSHILTNVSSSMQKDIEDILLGPPIAVSKVNESVEKVMAVVRKKLEKGELVINKDGKQLV
jgi:flagellar motor switch protein FliG